MKTRCYCGHPADLHEHLRTGSDCSQCGIGLCPAYVPRSAPMPPTHALVAAYSDAWTYRNLAALAPFAHTGVTQQHEVSIPRQRAHRGSIAGRFAEHLKTTRRT